jgi:hypothetical protein
VSSLNGSGREGHAPDAHEAAAIGATVLPAAALAARSGSGSVSGLRERRLELAERVAALTWDLGGLAYEMAIRDHYRLDVLARKAAELQDLDAQLGEVQRLLASAEAGIHGQCLACGAVHSRGAAYCWHCGAPLIEEARPSLVPSDDEAGRSTSDAEAGRSTSDAEAGRST